MSLGELPAPVPPLALKSRLRSAGLTLTTASVSYDIWWFYISQDTRDLDAMNVFPTFFGYDQEAHFRNLIISLHTLYDTQKGTNTVKSLLHEVAEPDAKPIWRKYKGIHDAVNKVEYLRHNATAHRNGGETYSDVFKSAAIRPDDVKKLIADTFEILTMIADAIGGDRPRLSPHATDDVAGLLAMVRKSIT